MFQQVLLQPELRGEIHLLIKAHGALRAELQIECAQRHLLDVDLLVAEAKLSAAVLQPEVRQLADVERLADVLEKLELFETSVADLKLAGAGGAIEVVEIALDRELAAPDAARLAGLPTGIGGHAVEVRLFKTEARLERPVVRLRPALELAAQRPARERGGQLGQREFARVPDERRAHILQDQRLRPDEALDVREALDLGPRDRRAGDAHSGAGERAFAVVVEELHGAAFDLEPRNVEDWSAFLFRRALSLGCGCFARSR